MKKLSIFFPIFWLPLLMFTPTPSICQTAEINKQIVTAITAGNAAELAKYFNTMVDLSIPGKEETYGKTQASMVLQDFFSKYPVKSYNTKKQGNSDDGSQFSIGRMESGNKIFRVYYLIKKSADNYLIHQFQIQEEN
jgi:Domain of unknown function (DUF4783)